MIAAEPSPDEGLVARLVARAAALARARTEALLLARRADPSRWRRSRLLWPMFTGSR